MSELDEPPPQEFDDMTFFPYALACTCCGLNLDDFEHLEALGVPTDLPHRVRVTDEDRQTAGITFDPSAL